MNKPTKRTAAMAQRSAAIERGLSFVYQTACVPENFANYGFDYLGCFHCIASTSKDVKLRRRARAMGRERARVWRLNNPRVPRGADVEDIVNLVFGSYAADCLGIRDDQLKKELRKAATKFSAQDYLGFDPTTESPARDLPGECDCGTLNVRGRKTCRDCRRRLSMMSRYVVWQDALIRTYTGDRYGVRLGASYADVLGWLSVMRPYPLTDNADDEEFYDAVYAVTHVTYTLNDYSSYQLSPRWLPPEYFYLKQNMVRAIEMDDPETMGEFLDSLKSFGLGESHPLVCKGVAFLLSSQNADGSWGEIEADDIYQRYHPTWTAIDGLREYAWRGRRLSFPEVAPLLNTARA